MLVKCYYEYIIYAILLMGVIMSEDNWPIYFYQTSSKKEPIKEFLDSLPAKDLAKARKRMKLLKEFGPFELGIPYIKQIEDKL